MVCSAVPATDQRTIELPFSNPTLPSRTRPRIRREAIPSSSQSPLTRVYARARSFNIVRARRRSRSRA